MMGPASWWRHQEESVGGGNLGMAGQDCMRPSGQYDVLCGTVYFSRYVSRYVCSLVRTLCFTICLFISPDLRRVKGTQNKALTLQDPQGLETRIRSHRVMFSSKYRLELEGARPWSPCRIKMQCESLCDEIGTRFCSTARPRIGFFGARMIHSIPSTQAVCLGKAAVARGC
jgi:hypothetical protein